MRRTAHSASMFPKLKASLQAPLSTLGPATLHIPSSREGPGIVGADKQGNSTISLKEQLGQIQGINNLRPNNGAEPPPTPAAVLNFPLVQRLSGRH